PAHEDETVDSTKAGVMQPVRPGSTGSRPPWQCPLRARGAKRLHFGRARILHQPLVFGRVNADQRDLAVRVVMNAPSVALAERRHLKVRVALAQERLAVLQPAPFRDAMQHGVHLESDVFFGVRVGMVDEQPVLDQRLGLPATSCSWYLTFGGRTVVCDLDQRVVVVQLASRQTSSDLSFRQLAFATARTRRTTYARTARPTVGLVRQLLQAEREPLV